MKKLLLLIQLFKIPLFVLACIGIHFLLGDSSLANIVLFIAILVGSLKLIKETTLSILKGNFTLDYIAIVAIIVGIVTGQYLVAAIIVLMLSGGHTLEEYGMYQARTSLTALKNRIPDDVTLWQNNEIGRTEKISQVTVGQEIFVRKGEVIPLDGELVSDEGLTDESSLTGEPYEVDKVTGDDIRSGTINIGNPIVIRVTKADVDSTYRKIIKMVEEAENEKAPLIRIADRYSTIFTIITFIICVFAYYISGKDFTRVLAVLVIATPCPLILATPIALIGGMNAAARKRIIIKTLASLEILARISDIIFDKTGTITLGKPVITDVKIMDDKYSLSEIYAISAAIERHSLHPMAKAIVEEAKVTHARKKIATTVTENIGSGISGVVESKKYTLSKPKHKEGMSIELKHGNAVIAQFQFEDQMKAGSRKIVKKLQEEGLNIYIFTGDKKAAGDRLAQELGEGVIVRSECTPEDKKTGIAALKKAGAVTAMVGDGINDAPALALADVGLVFSNQEHTAASEAADVVFLGGDFTAVSSSLLIARRTIQIALESILVGIGLSVIGMIFAALGYIPPVVGAFIQEAIDVAVIFNALRASKYKAP